MSQISSGVPSVGPGSGTVTSITFNGGLTAAPNPITTTGTATLDQSALTVVDGTVYWTGTGATGKLNTTATGSAGQILTSQGAGLPPIYAAAPAAGVSSVSGGNNITITGTATNPIVNVSGTTIHDVLLGNATGSINSLANGTTGQVLTAVTGADPAWTAIPGTFANSFPTDSGTATPSAGVLNIIAGNSTQNSGSSVLFTGSGNTVTLNVTDANNNTVIGKLAGSSTFTTSGSSSSVAIGYNAMHSGQNVTNCVAIGYNALQTANFGPQGVVAIGRSCGASIINASQGTMIGSECFSNGNGSNTCVGYQTLKNSTSGNGNICLGNQAGLNYTGSESDNILIGHAGVVTTDSGVIRIGTSGTQTSAFMAGIASVAVSNLNIVTINTATGQLGSASAGSVSSISITGDSGGALTGNAFTFTGGTTGLTFSGAGTTETLGGTLIVSNGGTGRATLTNHGLLVGAGTTAITQLAAATNGQLPIGSTGADPVLAAITAGAGISVTNGAGSITIAAIDTASTWSTITANQTAAVNNGYFINKAGTLALLLPAASAVGDVVEVVNINTATGTQVTQGAGQQIFIGSTNTTAGAGGSLTSTALGDTLRLVCQTANLTWYVVGSPYGNWTVV